MTNGICDLLIHLNHIANCQANHHGCDHFQQSTNFYKYRFELTVLRKILIWEFSSKLVIRKLYPIEILNSLQFSQN